MINLQMPADGKRAMFTNKLKISSNYDNKIETIEGMIPFSCVTFATLLIKINVQKKSSYTSKTLLDINLCSDSKPLVESKEGYVIKLGKIAFQKQTKKKKRLLVFRNSTIQEQKDSNTIIEEKFLNPVKGLLIERKAISPPPMKAVFDDLDQLIPRSICGSATEFLSEKYTRFH